MCFASVPDHVKDAILLNPVDRVYQELRRANLGLRNHIIELFDTVSAQNKCVTLKILLDHLKTWRVRILFVRALSYDVFDHIGKHVKLLI